jgi:3-deoxy-D-manno-octulosonate 8-phosphate phosphatase (KDO 8-P phosphatase)
MVTLDHDDLVARARRLRLVVTDVDGVLTDAGVYYDADGEVLKRFSVRDGMGVERLRDAGITTAIMTGESSPSVQRRAEKLRIEMCFLGVKDKASRLAQLLAELAIDPSVVAYVGDDVNDLPAMRLCAPRGLVAAPSDAMPDVADVAHFVSRAPGGHGAFRDIAEWLLKHRAEAET